mmetsp:Transcript_96583/g.171725  ORF Transcript_96583/g.171725 Transcript_96583/m.171725 type:complete len:253 (+) Transcript_96583:63-821(+)
MTVEDAQPWVPPESPSAAGRGREDIEQVLQLLAEASTDREACLAGCRKLEVTTLKSTVSQSRVLSADGAKVLSLVMAAHLKDSEVQLTACQLMQHLAAASPGPEKLAEAGACAAACRAMDAHAEEPILHRAACHVVELVAFGGEMPRSQAVTDGCTEAVLGALKKFKGNAAVQEACLGALQALAEDSEGKERINEASGLGTVVSCLAERREDAQVLSWGQAIITELCRDNPELTQDAKRKCHYSGLQIDFEL